MCGRIALKESTTALSVTSDLRLSTETNVGGVDLIGTGGPMVLKCLVAGEDVRLDASDPTSVRIRCVRPLEVFVRPTDVVRTEGILSVSPTFQRGGETTSDLSGTDGPGIEVRPDGLRLDGTFVAWVSGWTGSTKACRLGVDVTLCIDNTARDTTNVGNWTVELRRMDDASSHTGSLEFSVAPRTLAMRTYTVSWRDDGERFVCSGAVVEPMSFRWSTADATASAFTILGIRCTLWAV